ncbi:MAG: NACHT domain-containing protein [Armatimonadetes bacterium]|nr:NACHT domain-containing protein [Armatimonadota bacterium]
MQKSTRQSEKDYQAYLSSVYEQCTYLSTLALQGEKRSLRSLYQPLTLIGQGVKPVRVESYSKRLVPRHRKVLITDGAGMGKSTLAKFLLLCCVHEKAGMPVLLELRRLSRERKILPLLYQEILPHGKEEDRELLLRLIRQGGFVFFLDGYDEIAVADRDAVGVDLQSFISLAAANHFVVTSRPDVALAGFPQFTRFAIKGLTVEEAFALLRRYGGDNGLAEQIIEKITKEDLSAVTEFLANPLLVSLLYRAFEHKAMIPLRRHVFYRQVYDALFEAHDLTKGGGFERKKYTGLDLEQYHSVMRSLGFLTLSLGKVEYGRDELIAEVKKARERCPDVEFRENDFVNDLLNTVPVFTREGGLLRWSHKSLQEYFAAQFICRDTKGKQTALLRRLMTDPTAMRFQNVLELCADIDYPSFREAVLGLLLDQYLKHHAKWMARFRDKVRDEAIERCSAATFLNAVYFLPGDFVGDSIPFGSPRTPEKFFDVIRQSGRSAKDGWPFSRAVLAEFEGGGGLAIVRSWYEHAVGLLRKHGEPVFQQVRMDPLAAPSNRRAPAFMKRIRAGSLVALKANERLFLESPEALVEAVQLLGHLTGIFPPAAEVRQAREDLRRLLAGQDSIIDEFFAGRD